MRYAISLVFLIGLAFFLFVISAQLPLGAPPMLAGEAVLQAAPEQTGAANFVTSVVLAYRGLDTLGELAILFTAATAGGLVLGRRRSDATADPEAGFILRTAADLLFPLLLIVGLFIVVHGHLTPGGGFQGGVILAAAFFIPALARPTETLDHRNFSLIEALAGATFIGIGLIGLATQGAFLQPLWGNGVFNSLFSAGSLPLLYIAVGLKVGAELASLLAHITEYEAVDS